jgi:hypothetical protein
VDPVPTWRLGSKRSTVSIFDFEKNQRNLQLLPTSQEITIRNVMKKAKRTYGTVNSFRLYKKIFIYNFFVFTSNFKFWTEHGSGSALENKFTTGSVRND